MSQQYTIRELYDKGTTVTEIARVMGIDRKTAYRYINKDDFSPSPPTTKAKPSKLDAYKPLINKWLEDDRNVFHKQRHTARRIKERLRDECGFSCGLTTIQTYLADHRSRADAHASLILAWEAGSAQADFGQADCFIEGVKIRCHYLVLSLPYSNVGFAQMFRGETAECVCQGLKDIFEHIGGVPRIIVFDNATGVGRRIHEIVIESDLFARFRAHYRFEVRFCSPNAGREKGNAERKVAFLRSELLVPAPVFDDIVAFNTELLGRCAFQEGERHYAKDSLQGELFDEDAAHLLSLPRKPFVCVRYETAVSDGYGRVTVDKCHLYSSVPENLNTETIVGIGAHTVECLSCEGDLLASHPRAFGTSRTETIDAAAQLRLLSSRPRGWKNTVLRDKMPASVIAHLDALDTEGLRRDLTLLYDACERSGLEATLDALDVLAREHEEFPDFFHVGVLAARIAGFGLDVLPEGGADLKLYDEVFLGGGTDGQ